MGHEFPVEGVGDLGAPGVDHGDVGHAPFLAGGADGAEGLDLVGFGGAAKVEMGADTITS